jgi:hypothetical protein
LLPVAAVPGSLFAAKSLDQDSPHRLSGSRKEMAMRVPALSLFNIDQSEIGVVH